MIKTIVGVVFLNAFCISVYIIFLGYLNLKAERKIQIDLWSKDLKYEAYEIWKLCHKCEKCNSYTEYQFYFKQLLIKQKHFSLAIGVLYAAGYKRLEFYKKYCYINPKVPSLKLF
ncbi:MAG: hypothetical protein LBV03_00715 [Fusobacteriales bacterium]|jgi:hypothetical protein|nr:hypothetical protein [Fusobacteriales bacterium]